MPTQRLLTILIVLVSFSSIYRPVTAQSGDIPMGRRWALILCGLPGDPEHAQRMTGAVKQLITGAEKALQVDPKYLRVTAGDEAMSTALTENYSGAPITSSDVIQEMVRKLSMEIAPEDSVWIFVVGHADIEGRAAHWNIRGTDPDMQKLAGLLLPIRCKEKVIWVTTPLSGYAIRFLSAPDTVVISATDTDYEINGTELPYVLAEVLAGAVGAMGVEDRDEDGKLSLLDLYVTVCHETAQRFASEKLLLTEHALLDDNGDKRGSALHENYLPEELGGRKNAGRRRAVSIDGRLAARILLPHLPIPVRPPVSEPQAPSETPVPTKN